MHRMTANASAGIGSVGGLPSNSHKGRLRAVPIYPASDSTLKWDGDESAALERLSKELQVGGSIPDGSGGGTPEGSLTAQYQELLALKESETTMAWGGGATPPGAPTPPRGGSREPLPSRERTTRSVERLERSVSRKKTSRERLTEVGRGKTPPPPTDGVEGGLASPSGQPRWGSLKVRHSMAASLDDRLTTNRQIFGEVRVNGDEFEGEGEGGESGAIGEDGKRKPRPRPWYYKYSVDPTQGWRKNFDLVQVLILLYVAIVVPYRVGFGQPAEGPMYWLEICMDLFFWFDMGLNFVTGFDPGSGEDYIMDIRQISSAYTRGWLTMDMLACFPIDFISRLTQGTFLCSMRVQGCTQELTSNAQILRLLRLLRIFKMVKLLRLMRLGRIVQRYQNDIFYWIPLISFLKLIAVIFFLGHIFGCFFYFFSTEDWLTKAEKVALRSSDPTRHVANWFESESWDEGDPVDLTQRYIASLYWAFSTMTTVGYGDISATTKSERVFSIVGMIAGGFVFSYIVTNMLALMNLFDPGKRQLQERIDAVSMYLRAQEIPKETRSRVLAFCRRQKVNAQEERIILSSLPFSLRADILQYMYGGAVRAVRLFDGCEQIFVTEVCSRLQPVSYAPGEIIYQEGEIGTEMYIVMKGEVEVNGGNGKAIVGDDSKKEEEGGEGSGGFPELAPGSERRILSEGAYLGEGSVLGYPKRTEWVRAVTMVKVCAITTIDMRELMSHYPEVLPRFLRVYARRIARFSGQMSRGAADMKQGPGAGGGGAGGEGGKGGKGGGGEEGGGGKGGGGLLAAAAASAADGKDAVEALAPGAAGEDGAAQDSNGAPGLSSDTPSAERMRKPSMSLKTVATATSATTEVHNRQRRARHGGRTPPGGHTPRAAEARASSRNLTGRSSMRALNTARNTPPGGEGSAPVKLDAREEGLHLLEELDMRTQQYARFASIARPGDAGGIGSISSSSGGTKRMQDLEEDVKELLVINDDLQQDLHAVKAEMADMTDMMRDILDVIRPNSRGSSGKGGRRGKEDEEEDEVDVGDISLNPDTAPALAPLGSIVDRTA